MTVESEKEEEDLVYIFLKFIYLIYLVLAALGLCCCTLLSLVAESRGYSSLQCTPSHCGGFSCWGAWALGSRDSVVVAHGLSWSEACGIVPDQASNLCPLHWQADS